ncbi:ABC-type Co2+ transport system, periplasmic component [Candidatus Terasakiella magnetica]|nr:ABC-type Co2+ transport system, periplasmic component [Candidatus Terasakiella magnetica]
MSRNFALAILAVSSILGLAVPVQAHFQELIPSADIVPESGSRTIQLDLAFTHPMERGPVMAMGMPVRFGVLAGGKIKDLKAVLSPRSLEGKAAFTAAYTVDTPGDFIFFVEPAPYWEPAENKWIIHFAKVVVDFGAGSGWDKLVGLPVEIEPLVRPYGLWTGNTFRGIVRKNGKPVPFATVEVEWRNDGSVKAPSDPFITQVVKADASGQFAYSMPRSGWWGFNALVEADKPLKTPNGKPAPVEQGGLIWVHAVDMK